MKWGLLVLTIALIALSCKKDDDSTFKNITVSGIVIDSTSSTGIANGICELYWLNPNRGDRLDVTSATTNANGNFSISAKIDAANFSKGYKLFVGAKTPVGFYENGDFDVSRTMAEIVPNIESSTHRLWLYQKANLAITLRRTLTDSYTSFGFYYNWEILIPSSNFQAPLTVFNVSAPAGLFSFVRWSKINALGVLTSFKDSIRILPAVSNTITVNY